MEKAHGRLILRSEAESGVMSIIINQVHWSMATMICRILTTTGSESAPNPAAKLARVAG